MTEQEKLNSIKEDLKFGIKVWGIEVSEIKWLIQQAERIQELEEENQEVRKDCKAWYDSFFIAKEETQNYKQTIEEIRSYMEFDATIMMSDEDRLERIGKILDDYYRKEELQNEHQTKR